MTTRIACTALGGRIMMGRPGKQGNAFVGNMTDVTSDVLKAIIDKLEYHGGEMTIHEDGKPKWVIALSAQPYDGVKS